MVSSQVRLLLSNEDSRCTGRDLRDFRDFKDLRDLISKRQTLFQSANITHKRQTLTLNNNTYAQL